MVVIFFPHCHLFCDRRGRVSELSEVKKNVTVSDVRMRNILLRTKRIVILRNQNSIWKPNSTSQSRLFCN